jgi:hypothetical protein
MDERIVEIGGAKPNQQGCSGCSKALAVLGIIVVGILLLLPSVRSAREPARRSQCKSQLKQIALGLRQYADAHGTFPPAYTTAEDGTPLHSWRTLILPYVEESQLYHSIDLSKPWNDLVNVDAFKKVVDVYQCPSNENEDNRTTYLAVITPNSLLQATTGRTPAEIEKAASKTVMLIEVGDEKAVPWMQPFDADEQVVLGLGAVESQLSHPGVTHAAFGDGRVSAINFDMPEDVRRQLIDFVGNDEAAAKRE